MKESTSEIEESISEIDETMSTIDQYRALARDICADILDYGTAQLTTENIFRNSWLIQDPSDVEVLMHIGRSEVRQREEKLKQTQRETPRGSGRPAGKHAERDKWIRRFFHWLQEEGLREDVAIRFVAEDFSLSRGRVREVCRNE